MRRNTHPSSCAWKKKGVKEFLLDCYLSFSNRNKGEDHSENPIE